VKDENSRVAIAIPNPKDMSNVAAYARYRWTALFLVWGGFLVSYIDRRAWSSIAAPVGDAIGLEVAMLGVFVTAFYVGYVLANIVGGVLTDFFGARVMTAATLIPLGILTISFSFTRSLWFGIVIQAAMGLAAGADYSAGMKIIATWFRKDRGVAMGIFTTATSLAVVIANATVPVLSHNYGWETAFHILGIMTIIWGIISSSLLRNHPREEPVGRTSRHEVVGLVKSQKPQSDPACDRWLWRFVGDHRLCVMGKCVDDQAIRPFAGTGRPGHDCFRCGSTYCQASVRLAV